jgi:hypothetical protein
LYAFVVGARQVFKDVLRESQSTFNQRKKPLRKFQKLLLLRARDFQSREDSNLANGKLETVCKLLL